MQNMKTFKEYLKEANSKNIILCLDLDGVFADFEHRAELIYPQFNKIRGLYQCMVSTDEQKNLRQEMIACIKDDKQFWEDLPFIGAELYEFILSLDIPKENIHIITAPIDEDQPRCSTQKYNWVQKNLTKLEISKDRFHVRHDKHSIINELNISNTFHILIDDRKDNIDMWKQSGGIGMLYSQESVKSVIEQLRMLI